MVALQPFSVALLAALPGVFGASLPTFPNVFGASNALSPRQNTAPAGPDCGNTPTTRGQWCPGWTINTDYDLNAPMTGMTITYDLRITRAPCNPDGASTKQCTLINGQYPGPTLRAKWGDTLRVIVHNDVPDNGTSIHWHGVRQLRSTQNDGGNGVTECPIAPGQTRTYQFLASQHGTSWYHSHHSGQYGEGVVGLIVFDGPTTANYDVDLGPLPLTDWYYESTWALTWRALHGGAPPPSQNVLVNGTMKSATGTGKYNVITVQPNKSYKLRLVNTAVDHQFIVSLDGHPFTVVAADFVPIVPRTNVKQVTLGVGQRMDIIFTANQAAGNYWLRVLPGCGTPPGAFSGRAQIYDTSVTVGSIIRYQGAANSNPTSTGYPITQNCDEEPTTPFWPRTIPSTNFVSTVKNLPVTLGQSTRNGENIFTWFVNGSTMVVDWQKPTLQYVLDGNNNFPPGFNLHEVNGANTWTYWVINTAGLPLPHPIHLHGHDFWVLGTGTGTFNPTSTAGLTFNNPRRRDTAIIPGNGWMVIAFVLDNPGAWLMHCHIGWHVSQGFGLQFLERKSEIVGAVGQLDEFRQGCTSWKTFWNSAARIWSEEDSGI